MFNSGIYLISYGMFNSGIYLISSGDILNIGRIGMFNSGIYLISVELECLIQGYT